MTTQAIEFVTVSPTETKFSFGGYKFMLIEQSRGVYGIGRAVQLYQLDGVKKDHVKEIGWTKGDNHGGMDKSDAYENTRLVTAHECRSLAVDYLTKLI